MNRLSNVLKPAAWLLPLSAVLLASGCCCFLPSPGTPRSAPVVAAPPPPPPAPAPAPVEANAFVKNQLPTGVELHVPAAGIESRLVAFIKDESRPVDKTTWFDFDRLLFASGKATLEPASNEQLDNIAQILTAYPRVNVKIGGYTDDQGDDAYNMALSKNRADNVKAEIVKRGIDAARLEAEGYGEQHPVADNATPEGRAQNRRISLRVTQK